METTDQQNQRIRFLQQVDLAEVPLTTAQADAVDAICDMLPVMDSPTLLQLAAVIDRPEITRLLATLPQTRVIERIAGGQWPQ